MIRFVSGSRLRRYLLKLKDNRSVCSPKTLFQQLIFEIAIDIEVISLSMRLIVYLNRY